MIEKINEEKENKFTWLQQYIEKRLYWYFSEPPTINEQKKEIFNLRKKWNWFKK